MKTTRWIDETKAVADPKTGSYDFCHEPSLKNASPAVIAEIRRHFFNGSTMADLDYHFGLAEPDLLFVLETGPKRPICRFDGAPRR